jgi:hypothetical protein
MSELSAALVCSKPSNSLPLSAVIACTPLLNGISISIVIALVTTSADLDDTL